MTQYDSIVVNETKVNPKSPAKSSTCFFSSPSWPVRYTTPLLRHPSKTRTIVHSSSDQCDSELVHTDLLPPWSLNLGPQKITKATSPCHAAMPGGFSDKTFRKSAIFGPLCFCTSTATSTALPMNLAEVDGLQLDSGDVGFLRNSVWMLKQKCAWWQIQKPGMKQIHTNTVQYKQHNILHRIWDVLMLARYVTALERIGVSGC